MSVNFDGSTYFIRTGQQMIHQSSKVGVFSAWIKPDGTGGENTIVHAFVPNFTIVRVFQYLSGADLGFDIQLFTSGSLPALRLRTVGGEFTAGVWSHVLVSWDLANARGDVFIDDTLASLSVTVINDLTIGYDVATEWATGGEATIGFAGANPFFGTIDEIYLHTEEYLDITIEANRRQFYGPEGSQIGLGHQARNPTQGTQPLLFYTNGPGNFGTNQGSGLGGPLVSVGNPTFTLGRPAAVETLSRGFWGERWRESERSGIPFRESRLVTEPATGLEVARREFSTDRDEINRRRRFGNTIFEF